jgi:hypothetical protein
MALKSRNRHKSCDLQSNDKSAAVNVTARRGGCGGGVQLCTFLLFYLSFLNYKMKIIFIYERLKKKIAQSV